MLLHKLNSLIDYETEIKLGQYDDSFGDKSGWYYCKVTIFRNYNEESEYFEGVTLAEAIENAVESYLGLQ